MQNGIKSSFIKQRSSTARGLNKTIPEANYRSKKKNKKKKIHGNDKSFNFALASTKHVRMAPVMEEKKKQRHLGGTSDGREEEAGTLNPHTSSNSNRARIILAIIKRERLVPVIGNLTAVAPKI